MDTNHFKPKLKMPIASGPLLMSIASRTNRSVIGFGLEEVGRRTEGDINPYKKLKRERIFGKAGEPKTNNGTLFFLSSPK
jgi:hypothetical protein